MSSIAGITWTDRSPAPLAQAGAATALLRRKLYAAGGTLWRDNVKLFLKSVQVYDPASDAWTSSDSLPEPTAYAAFEQLAGGFEIYGGCDDTAAYDKCWRFSPEENSWRALTPLPRPLVFSKALHLAGAVYLFGGSHSAPDLTHATIDVLRRADQGHWEKVSALPAGASLMPGAAAARGRAWLFGGFTSPQPGVIHNTAQAWSFHPQSGWHRLRDLPRAVRGLAAVAVQDRFIVLSGGYTASQREAEGKPPEFGFTSDVLIYDIANNSYSTAASMPEKIMSSGLLLDGDTIYSAGGENRLRGRSARLLAGRF
jgi:N-acetylneuraminic acid mutarotase